MIPDERSRKFLYDGVVEVLGAERADILMAYLPAVEWTALATKQDLLPLEQGIGALKQDIAAMKRDVDNQFGLVRAEMQALAAELRGEMGVLRFEMRTEMTQLRGELGGEMLNLRGELQKQFVTQTWRLAGLIVALNALAIAAFSLR